MHDVLSKERKEEHAEPSGKGAGFVLVTDRALTEHNHHMVQINRRLAIIERDMAVISEHCHATDNEFQKAVQRYREEYCRDAERVRGLAIALKQAKAALR